LRTRRQAADGEHFLLGSGREQHQLWLREPVAEGRPLAAIIPLDEFASLRCESTLRFLRHAQGKPTTAAPKPNSRFPNMLRAVDGHASGFSYRSIAECLFGRPRLASEPWKTSSIRDATIRLVRSGVALVRGGYRKLLRK
jgi:hypothetical protein